MKTNRQASNAPRNNNRNHSAIQDRVNYIRQNFGENSARHLPDSMSAPARAN